MTSSELVIAVFTLFNGLRILAYIPQLRCILNDCNGATSVSCTSWGLFGVSHAVTALYSLTLSGDVWLALNFAANALCCAAIVILTANTRRRYRAGFGLLQSPQVA